MYNTFSKQQIRDLGTLIKKTDWRFDIIGKMPPELVLLVFEKLDHCNAFSCRRVSRRWLDLLSNDLVTGTLIRSWRSLGDFELIIPEGASQRHIHSLVAEHEHAFRTGNAFSRLCLNIDLDAEDVAPVWAYCGGYIAWLTGRTSANKIALYHIESGRRSSFLPTNRENIHKFALSSELLVVTTHGGKCYIWAHQSDRPPCTIRLPSTYIIAMCVSADKAVFLTWPTQVENTIPHSQWSILVVECDTAAYSFSLADKRCERPIIAKSHEFPIAFGHSAVTWKPRILLDKAKSHIIYVDPFPERNGGIHLIEFNLKGEIQFEGYLAVGPQNNAYVHGDESCLNGRENLFNIWLVSSFDRRFCAEGEQHSLEEPMDYIHAQYYPNRRSFEVKTKESYSYSFKEKYNLHPHIWKGITYCDLRQGKHAKRKADMRVIDLEKGTCVYRDIGSLPGAAINETTALLGDEIFLVRGCNSGFDVWCFDKNLRMSGEDPIFRKKRERALHYRLKQQESAVLSRDEASASPEVATSRKIK